jgi:hypothetical protein
MANIEKTVLRDMGKPPEKDLEDAPITPPGDAALTAELCTVKSYF